MRHHPLPVVVVSSIAAENSETALRALELGAVEVVPKPGSQFSVPDVRRRLASAIRAAAGARVGPSTSPGEPQAVRVPAPGEPHSANIIAIGASAGGTVAIEYLLRRLPDNLPGIVIVQHMPAGFTRKFAERLDRVCQLQVREATDRSPVEAGTAWVAPGGYHTIVQRTGTGRILRIREGPPVNRHKPSVDVLFHSIARTSGPNAIGVVLSGMGNDGAKGLLAMRSVGARTIAQDEESSIVYGMPKAAAELGAADRIAALDQIPALILASSPQPAF